MLALFNLNFNETILLLGLLVLLLGMGGAFLYVLASKVEKGPPRD
ncbi:MAG TPA: hypothetical protein VFA26_12190 [Gemmataceae bacterium]|nr:hypothetical protein [Gemmataceae bacterium]